MVPGMNLVQKDGLKVLFELFIHRFSSLLILYTIFFSPLDYDAFLRILK
jgi:hypothetical protein